MPKKPQFSSDGKQTFEPFFHYFACIYHTKKLVTFILHFYNKNLMYMLCHFDVSHNRKKSFPNTKGDEKNSGNHADVRQKCINYRFSKPFLAFYGGRLQLLTGFCQNLGPSINHPKECGPASLE